MTIEEAVEIYNSAKEKIKTIERVTNLVADRRPYIGDPFGNILVTEEQLHTMFTLLGEYKKVIESKLKEKFEPESSAD